MRDREASLDERLITRLRDAGVPRRTLAVMFGISVDTVTDTAARVRHCDPIYPDLFPSRARVSLTEGPAQ